MVYTKGLGGFGGIVIVGMVGLDIFFLGFISGASMNPARSLAPALYSGVIGDLWLYWSATFIGLELQLLHSSIEGNSLSIVVVEIITPFFFNF
ncbi:MAG TPA: aquaporin [Nitrososphaeraceae archaeon]|nr:aquaporin [Nitrososphaeraceae archaeon]